MTFLAMLLTIFLFAFGTTTAHAVTDPLSVPNNKIGIHILFPDEIHQASAVINNQGLGAWGYVTIPIQASDRDRRKWQNFFDKCKEEKVIPLLRLATVPSGSNWELPGTFDLIDFANFLNELEWPVKNRYVIIFNEVNRPDEFGGKVSPEKYADILNNAIDVFKERSDDFFILPAGLDNAAINQYGSMYWKEFLYKVNRRHPGIFDKIDGWNSHAYPNPDFSSRPDATGHNKIDSFRYDLKYLKQFTDKKLPVFITETGWSTKYLSEKQVGLYYDYAFSKIWSDENVVAVTPFLLNAQDGPFQTFSFFGREKSVKEFAANLSGLAVFGEPAINNLETLPTAKNTLIATPEAQVMGSSTDYQALFGKIYNNIDILFDFLSK